MSCPATPENPCFCKCHLAINFEGEPYSGFSCDDCPVFKGKE